jgi:hypothetical protein
VVVLQGVVADVVGPLVVGLIVLGAIALFGAVLYTEHRKEMKLIETGQYPEGGESDRWVLAAGLVLLALGLADLLRAAWVGESPGNGLTLALLGVAALVYVAFRHREERRAASGREDGPVNPDEED